MDKKNGQKLVSVIIPACNEERYISRALDSLARQSHKKFEVIVSINGSTDATLDVVKNHANLNNYPSSIVHTLQRLDPAEARNRGAHAACGEVLLFLDADCALSDNSLAVIAETESGSFGTCKAGAEYFSPAGFIFFAFKNFLHRFGLYKGVLGAFFCEAELFKKVRGFSDKRVGEWSDLILRAGQAGGRYTYLKNCSVGVSLRRFEKNGYLKTFWFWCIWIVRKILRIKKPAKHEYTIIR